MRWLALLVGVLCAGCDVIVGVDESPAPCGTASFAKAKQTVITPADDFSISWDLSFAVLVKNGWPYEMALPNGMPIDIDLGVYNDEGLSINPEGNAVFFTAMIEPAVLHAAVRTAPGMWKDDPIMPVGTFAGTPSADEFGPKRVLVLMQNVLSAQLQEYENDDGLWKPVGDAHPNVSDRAPNLTPNGLTMVYNDGTGAVGIATRKSTADWFGDPVTILRASQYADDHTAPQLLDQCRQLYVIDHNDNPLPGPEGDTNNLVRYAL
jgi:hypothetical protein